MNGRQGGSKRPIELTDQSPSTSDEIDVGSDHPPPSWRTLEDRQNSERTFRQFGSAPTWRNTETHRAMRRSADSRSPPHSSRHVDSVRRRGSLEPEVIIVRQGETLTNRQAERIRYYESLPERQIENLLQAPEGTFDTHPVITVEGVYSPPSERRRPVHYDPVPSRRVESPHSRQFDRIRYYESTPERQVENLVVRQPRGQVHHDSVNHLTPNWEPRKNNYPLSTENMKMPSETRSSTSEAGRSGSQPVLAWRQENRPKQQGHACGFDIHRPASLPTLAGVVQESALNQQIAASSAPSDIPQIGQQTTYEIVQPPQRVDIPVLTGSISQMQQWYDTIPMGSLFEVTGYLVGIIMANPQNPMGPGNEMNYILRDRRDSGPIIQIIQPYQINFQMQQPLEQGLRIRCIGRIISKQRLLAFKVSIVSEELESEFNRVEHVCRTRY